MFVVELDVSNTGNLARRRSRAAVRGDAVDRRIASAARQLKGFEEVHVHPAETTHVGLY